MLAGLMGMTSAPTALTAFAAARPELIALAYRMLGDLGRAEDLVQEAWLRWERHSEGVESPKAYLVTMVTRLCLNELQSAKVQREHSRSDRLPEPVDVARSSLSELEHLEQISMAFLVMLQRLSPAERAVLLLHDVFDFEHSEIADLIHKSTAACRKLLERARTQVASTKRSLPTDRAEHLRLLRSFMDAATLGDTRALVEMLADNAVMITDGGEQGRTTNGVRNLPRPLEGAERIAAFVAHTTAKTAASLQIEDHELNGQPGVVFKQAGQPFAALLLEVDGGKIQRVYFHADLSRLRHLGEPGLPGT
ncbi:MAG: sigma-70 family RNA polymerase sigma factor [Myxococcales bacterium]